MNSILLPMIRGYLVICGGLDQPYHKSFVASEAERIAADIRTSFGRFDESDRQRCATVIRAVGRSWKRRQAEFRR